MYTNDRKYSTEQIAQVERQLAYGDKKEITKRLKCHRNHVHQVFKCVYYDQRVIDAALEVMSERLERQAKVKNKLDHAMEAIDHLKAIAAL